MSKPADRQALFDGSISAHPQLSVLVNSAGIQRRVDLTAGARDLTFAEEEIATNLSATVALSGLFAPHLSSQPGAVILNISSGLASVPIASMPVSCATKAAFHSFTVSLRHHLKPNGVRVFEAIHPTTDTALDQGRRSTQARGIPAKEVARAIVQAIEQDTRKSP